MCPRSSPKAFFCVCVCLQKETFFYALSLLTPVWGGLSSLQLKICNSEVKNGGEQGPGDTVGELGEPARAPSTQTLPYTGSPRIFV